MENFLDITDLKNTIENIVKHEDFSYYRDREIKDGRKYIFLYRIILFILKDEIELLHNDSFIDENRNLFRPQIYIKIPLKEKAWDAVTLLTNFIYDEIFKIVPEYGGFRIEISMNLKYSDLLEARKLLLLLK